MGPSSQASVQRTMSTRGMALVKSKSAQKRLSTRLTVVPRRRRRATSTRAQALPSTDTTKMSPSTVVSTALSTNRWSLLTSEKKGKWVRLTWSRVSEGPVPVVCAHSGDMPGALAPRRSLRERSSARLKTNLIQDCMSYCRDNFLELVYLWSPDQLFKIRHQVGHLLSLFYYIMIS
ncbi:hypothetical protein LEMLEM_LOCUS3557, partial [Lemmus lemmus]